MNGIDTREQRKAHIKALVDEVKDLKRSLALAEERLEGTPEDKLVQRARAQQRVNHLNERIAATDEQLATFTAGARTPRQAAEKRSQGSAPPAPGPTPKPTPQQGGGNGGQRSGGGK